MLSKSKIVVICLVCFVFLDLNLPAQQRACDPNPKALRITYKMIQQGQNGLARIRVTGTVKNIGNCVSRPTGRIQVKLLEAQKGAARLLSVKTTTATELRANAKITLTHEKEFNKRDQKHSYYRLAISYFPTNMNRAQMKLTDVNLKDNIKDVATTGLYNLIVDDAQKLTIASGNNQKVPLKGSSPESQGNVGTAKFNPLKVRLSDWYNNGIANTSIKFSNQRPQGMAIQFLPSGVGSSVSLKTDANGYAELNALMGKSIHAYYATGKFTVIASADKVGSQTFNLEVLPNPAYVPVQENVTLKILAGNNQRIPRSSGVPLFSPLKVEVRKTNGDTLAKANVVFKGLADKPELRLQLTPSGGNMATVKSDHQGIATLDKMSGKSIEAHYGDGKFRVEASCGQSKVYFNMEVPPLRPASPNPPPSNRCKLTIVSGDRQQVRLKGIFPHFGGMAKFAPLKVRLTDSKGFGVATKRVDFRASGPPPMVVLMSHKNSTSSTDNHSVITDSKGYALLKNISRHSIFCHNGSGDLIVTADSDRADPVTFRLKVLPKEKKRGSRKKKKN